MKKQISIIIALVLIIAAGFNYLIKQKGGNPTGTPNGMPGAMKPAEVTAMVITPKNAVIYEELPGRIVAYKSAEIRPQVSGIITERLFEEGSYVEEGQQLYQINPDIYKATLDSAIADLGKAEANVKSISAKNERFKDLVKINAISKQEYDDTQASLAQAQADVAIAEAAVASAKINLNYTKVYAPISGRIGKSSVTKGALVTASQVQALATITQLDPVYVDMNQSSTDLMRLRHKIEDGKNIPVTLLLEGEKNSVYQHEGMLQFHEVTVDQTTGSVQLRALFPNPDKLLLPGMFVRARLSLEYENIILIPQKAANRNPDGSLAVWLINAENIINPAIITVDKSMDGQWIVTSGLKAGDTIVIGGGLNLQPGAKVAPSLDGSKPALPAETPAPANGK